MTTSDVLLIDDPLPGVRRLTLNRPEKRNALNNGLRDAIFGALTGADRDQGVRVSVIEPGIVDTPLVQQTTEGAAELAAVRALDPQDVARVIAFVLEQPAHVNIDEIMISPLGQEF